MLETCYLPILFNLYILFLFAPLGRITFSSSNLANIFLTPAGERPVIFWAIELFMLSCFFRYSRIISLLFCFIATLSPVIISFIATFCSYFFNTSSEGRIELDLSSIKKYIEPIENGDIACIEKDFGEILGPFLFFRLFNDCKVVFPTVSNEPLIDYYINGYKVSAKQLGGGGKPAGKDLMLKTVANLKKNVENELDDLKKEKDQMNKKEKKAMYDYKEIEFINNIAISYNMSVFDQKNSLIQKYVVDKYLSNNEAFKKFKNLANKKHSKLDFPKINEILDSNIISLKIEGRMKSPEYVGFITNYYRKLIDGKTINKLDEKKLKLLFNRDFTEGYLFHNEGKNIMNIKTSNHQGIEIGKIIETSKKYLKIKLTEDLNQEDGIRFENNKGMIMNENYKKEEWLKMVNIRYAMNLTSYRKYIGTTIAANVSEKTVAVIMENAYDLPGVTIEEDTIRKYQYDSWAEL